MYEYILIVGLRPRTGEALHQGGACGRGRRGGMGGLEPPTQGVPGWGVGGRCY